MAEEKKTIDVILPYVLVEEIQNFETMWRIYRFGNTITNFLCRRAVTTKVWQTTLKDGAAFPGIRNPGGLAEPWRASSVSMSAPTGVLLRRIVREVWTQKGEWEFLEDD